MAKLSELCKVDWGDTSLTKSSYIDCGKYLGVSAAGCDGRMDYYDYDAFTPVISAIGANCGKLFLPKEPFVAIKNTITLKPNNLVSGKYLYYALLNNRIPKRGGGQPFISKGDTEQYDIPCPSRIEQDRIVEILDRVSEVLNQRMVQISILDEFIKARFVEMFGEPIANPMNWDVKPLKSMSTLITNGNTPKGGSDNYVDNGILFLRSQNVWRNRIELEDVAYIDEATHNGLKKSSLHNKDILITKTGRINTENSSLGRAALFVGEDNSANINGHVYLVRLDGSVVPEFVVTILTGEAYRRYIRKVCVGGIDKRQINLDQVEEFPIILPPYEQQQDFAAFIAQVDKSKVAVQKALDEAQVLFNSLMQQYFG